MTAIGYIFDIKKYAVYDGPGIRTTIFFKGCPLNCWWCHNPESQVQSTEKILKSSFRTSSNKYEDIGMEMKLEKVISEIQKDELFYEESGGGVTFSGGEPLMQIDFLKELLDYCKDQQIHTSLDTCGHTSWEQMEKIKDKVDLFLWDIKLINEQEHQKYTGVSNKWILSNLRKLDSEHKNISIRIPIIPTITSTNENIEEIIQFLESLENHYDIELLPYHTIGKGKYKRLQREYKLDEIVPPTKEEMDDIKKSFTSKGYNLKISG